MARRGCSLICAETDFKKGNALIDVLIKDPDAEPDPDLEELRTRGDARCFVCGCNLQHRPTAWLIFVMNEDTYSPQGFCSGEHDSAEIEAAVERRKEVLSELWERYVKEYGDAAAPAVMCGDQSDADQQRTAAQITRNPIQARRHMRQGEDNRVNMHRR